MIPSKPISGVAAAAVALLFTAVARGDQLTIDLVPVGNPNNPADTEIMTTDLTSGYGTVGYDYQIGKYEVTAGQYTAFLNAVAKTDTYGLYSAGMAGADGCGILRTGSPGSYTYNVDVNWADRPVNYVSWGDAARFANWLNNRQPRGLQNTSTTEDGAYSLNGATTNEALMAATRNSGATWVIPTEDEWYKAAFYDPDKQAAAGYWDYPTRSDAPPGRDMSESTNPGNNANYNLYGSGIPQGDLIGPLPGTRGSQHRFPRGKCPGTR